MLDLTHTVMRISHFLFFPCRNIPSKIAFFEPNPIKEYTIVFLFTIKIAEKLHSSHIYRSFMHSLVSMLNGYSEKFQI